MRTAHKHISFPFNVQAEVTRVATDSYTSKMQSLVIHCSSGFVTAFKALKVFNVRQLKIVHIRYEAGCTLPEIFDKGRVEDEILRQRLKSPWYTVWWFFYGWVARVTFVCEKLFCAFQFHLDFHFLSTSQVLSEILVKVDEIINVVWTTRPKGRSG